MGNDTKARRLGSQVLSPDLAPPLTLGARPWLVGGRQVVKRSLELGVQNAGGENQEVLEEGNQGRARLITLASGRVSLVN